MEIGSGGGVRKVIGRLTFRDGFVSLRNGRPGLRYAFVIVNRHVFHLANLADGEVVTLDVRSVLLSDEPNVLAIEGYGRAGVSATIAVSEDLPRGEAETSNRAGYLGEVSAGYLLADDNIVVPQLKIAREDQAVVLSWPASNAGYKVQSCTDLSSQNAWEEIPGNPAQSDDGLLRLSVPVDNGPKMFRLYRAWSGN